MSPTSSGGWNLTPNESTIQILNAAEYIFEGEKIESRSYYNKDSSMIYTSSKVKVSAVYKGNLTEGQIIELIEGGGAIGLDNRIDKHNKISVGYRKPYLLFCRKTAVLPISDKAYNWALQLNYISKGYVKYAEDSDIAMFGLNRIGFKTKQDLDALLLKIPGVHIPTSKKKVHARPISNLRSTNTLSFEDLMAEQQKRSAIAKANKSLSNVSSAQLRVATNDLTLTLANEQIIEYNGDKFYEFDVMASANNSITYFSNAIIRLNYNTLAFGSNLATTSNNLLLINGGGISLLPNILLISMM
jgi:hypothetical protein